MDDESSDTEVEMDEWLENVGINEARASLKLLLKGHSQQAERQFRSQFLFAASPSGMAGARRWCGGSKVPGYGGESPTLDLIAGRSHPSRLSGIIIQSLMTSLADY